MKNKLGNFITLLGMLAILILAVSCSDSGSDPVPGSGSSSSDAFPIEFIDCDFEGATVAYIEFFDGITRVAYGYGDLVDGDASFTMKDIDTDGDWYPELGVAYTAYAYCFAGSVGDPVPASGYWSTLQISQTVYKKSDYVNMELYKGYFSDH